MHNTITECEVEQEILLVFIDKLKCNKDILQTENYQKPLTWEPFYFSVIDMAYLFFEVEKQFSIKIPEQFLHEYGFSTIEQIINTVNNLVSDNLSNIE